MLGLTVLPALYAGQKRRDAPSIVLPQQDADVISHIALDIGGSLIKLVYFSPDAPALAGNGSGSNGSGSSNGRSGGDTLSVPRT